MKRSALLASVLMMAATILPAVSLQAKTDVAKRRVEISNMRDEVLKELYQLRPELKSRIKDAPGYAVFSNVGVNLLIASFAGGHGIVVQNGFIHNTETYMKMGAAGIGPGLGVKDFRAVFIFNDKAKLKEFLEKGWDFSGQVDAAAKSDEKGGAIGGAGSFTPGVEVYQITRNGIALQATLQGTKFWRDKDLN